VAGWTAYGWQRWRKPIVLGAFALLCLTGVIDSVLRPLSAHFDRGAEEVVDDIAARAAVAFAISRSINAALSFAEEVTISAGVLIEGSVNPAKVLEPVNNLIEQFADIMLAVAIAALMLKILLGVGAAWGVSVFLAAALVVFCLEGLARNRPRLWKPRMERLGFALLLLAFLLRLALPAALFATHAVSEHFLADRYAEAEDSLRSIQSKAEAASSAVREADEVTAEDGGGSWFAGKAASAVDLVRKAFGAVSDVFGGAFESVVAIATVFLFETMLLPVALVLLIYRAFLTLARPAAYRPD